MASSVPSALTQFTSIASAALPTGFLVRVDEVFGPFVPSQALLVTGVRFTQDEYAELGPNYKHEEHYNILCSLYSSAGNPDSGMERMNEVYALYNDVTVAVATKPDLNQTVRLGWCRQLDFRPTHDVKGLPVGQLDFEVEVQARVLSLS